MHRTCIFVYIGETGASCLKWYHHSMQKKPRTMVSNRNHLIVKTFVSISTNNITNSKNEGSLCPNI